MNAKEINKISIKNFLMELNIYSVKDRGYYGLYCSPFREDHNASMKVDYEKNLWMDYQSGPSTLVYQKGRRSASMNIRFFNARILTLEEEKDIFEGELWVKNERILLKSNIKR